MIDLGNTSIILASKSPRRIKLLAMLGIEFTVIASSVDESAFQEPDPATHAMILSTAKAKEVAQSIHAGLIVGADSIVVLGNRIIGKPASLEDAKNILKDLSGNTHQVYTGYTIIEKPGERSLVDYEVTNVHFRNLHEWEIDYYVSTCHPLDKAGAYGIQDLSAIFVDRIEGCFYNVVGFPLARFYLSLVNFMAQRN